MSESDPSDVALYLIGELLDNIPDDTHLYQMDLHKILYLLQQRLDDENAVADQLPFYWYRHGPVTEAAFQAGDQASRKNIAETEETDSGTRFLSGPKTPPSPSISAETGGESREDMETAVAELKEIASRYDFHQERDQFLEEEIYSDAPFAFQPEAKFRLLPAVEGFATESTVPSETLVDRFHRAEGKLPLDKEFAEFNDGFSRLVTLADTFLHGDVDAHPLLKAELQELVETAWRVFSNHLQYRTADEHYAESRRQWREKARQSQTVFRQELDSFEQRLADKEFFNRDASRAEGGESWAAVAESMLTQN